MFFLYVLLFTLSSPGVSRNNCKIPFPMDTWTLIVLSLTLKSQSEIHNFIRWIVDNCKHKACCFIPRQVKKNQTILDILKGCLLCLLVCSKSVPPAFSLFRQLPWVCILQQESSQVSSGECPDIRWSSLLTFWYLIFTISLSWDKIFLSWFWVLFV